MDLLSIVMAFATGIVGAAIGSLESFIWCGFLGMAMIGIDAATGVGVTFGLAFGWWFAPLYGFLGGAMAAGYARKMGYMESGKAIGIALTSLKKPDVLLVGGVVSVIGYLCLTLMTSAQYIGWAGVDGMAFWIFILSVIGKAVFDGGKIFGTVSDEAKAAGGRFGGHTVACWLPWQRTGWEKIVIGLGFALAGGYGTWLLLQNPDTAAFAPFLGFFISASTLILLQFGQNIPVTHHISLTAGYAVVMYAGAGGTDPATALVWALGVGIAAAFVGDFWSDVFYAYGDVHVDPPAMAIATMSLFTMTIMPLFGTSMMTGVVVPLVLVAICLVVAVLCKSAKAETA